MNKWYGLLISAVITLLALLTSFSQVDTISGVVSDLSGRPVPGAIVRVKGTDISTLTDSNGSFNLIDFIPALRTRVTAWKDGYYTAGADALPWNATVDLTLSSYIGADNPDYAWIPPAIETRSKVEEWITQTGLYLADWISFNRIFQPLAERLTLGCRDCHGQTIYNQWAASAHALGGQNARFLTMYNGMDLSGNQSPTTRFGYSRDYGSFPLPPDSNQPYYGPGYKLDFPETAGNCATCHLPTAATEQHYARDPNQVDGVRAQGTHCDFCHKIATVKLDTATGQPYENMPGILSIELMRPSSESQLFFGPYDDVDVGPDTYLPLMKQSEICAPCHSASFWGVPIYQSFSEWQASPYPAEGKTCQTCHMQPDGVTTNFAPGRGGVERDPNTIPTHSFPGATDETLLENTAEMTVITQRKGDQLIVDVSVTNTEGGHHIPTGSPLRQIFLVVRASDEKGRTLVLQNGPKLPDWSGNLKDLPGVYFAKILEQLWTGITPTGAYWTPTRLVEDNRLPARSTNTSHYVFGSQDSGDINVEAQLIFRRAYYELMQQKGWETPDIMMESISVSVPE